MLNNKAGFLNESVIISKLDEPIIIHIFVDTNKEQSHYLMGCGNIDIVDVNIPVYGIGTIKAIARYTDINERCAYIKYSHSLEESIIRIDFDTTKSKDKFWYDEEKRVLTIDSLLLDVSSIQVIANGKKLKSYSKKENLYYYRIDETVAEIFIGSRFYTQTIKTGVIEKKLALAANYTYSVSYEYEKTILKVDTSMSNEKYILVEGDFRGFKELSDGDKKIEISNSVFFKDYKEYNFSINGNLEKAFIIKPGSYPTNFTWIYSQKKIKFNKNICIPAIIIINNKYQYEISPMSSEFIIPDELIPELIILKDKNSGKVLLEKTISIAPAPEQQNIPVAYIDVNNYKFKLDSISKHAIQINIQGIPTIFIKPGEISVDFSYHFFNKKGVIKFCVDSYTNCIIREKYFYIIV